MSLPHYDIVFIGHISGGEIHRFDGTTVASYGGAPFFGAAAARVLGKKLLVITRINRAQEGWLEPLKAAGIDVFVQWADETSHMRVIYPVASVDERTLFLMRSAGPFLIDQMPGLEPTLIHLGGLSDQEFTVDFMASLKEQGFRLSVDMQGFVCRVDRVSGSISYCDVPRKHDIVRMADFVKLDANEARAVTGTDDPAAAAATLEAWGSRETVITRADGVLVRCDGRDYFERFCYRSVEGRTGRGDTLMGAYLACRMEQPIEESVRFATALTSMKVEVDGPFRGTVADVLRRVGEPRA